MHRCACSTRALELFVHDIAGVHVRQQRAQAFFQQYRNFGTRTACRQVASPTVAQTVDDAFIPFGVARGSTNRRWVAGQSSSTRPQEGEEEVLRDGDWHAEIEVLSPTLSPHQDAAESVAGGAMVETEHAPEPGNDTGHEPKRGTTTSASTPKASEVPGRPKSRTEGRLERKLRRIEAGTYKAAAEAQGQRQDAEKQVEAVLAKLEELDGPKIPTRAAKQMARNERRAKGDVRATTIAGTKKPATIATTGKAVASKEAIKSSPKPKKEIWQAQKAALDYKFGEVGWQPRKRLSPDTLEGIRALHASDPTTYSTEMLSEHFKVTPEAVRRILKSKWKPSEEESEDRRARWERRGAKKWQEMAEQGMRAPARWRAMGVGGGEGLKEDRMPKRKKVRRRDDDGLSWDDSVADIRAEEEASAGSLAERLL